ncbi:DsbA family oxidoreductase [Albidovulum sp.]|uniref:DsbA family oxidoreductase n=1 Tax=Albidovulum sp. TaxID=1872424 RepID=UPI0039B912A3
MIRLDILSDIVCPWCYVGKAFLDRALEAHPDHPFAIEWHPFQLDPAMPREGLDRRAYMEAKFGGPEGVARAHQPLIEHAKAAGVELNLGRIERSPNTLDAHRLIHWAGLEGRQTAMVSALFRAYWRDGRDVGEAEVLAAVAGEVGLDREMIRRLLASDGDVAEIRAREAHARERGVNAVPTFIIANRHVVQGAQPAEVWGRIIEDIAGKLKDSANV